MLETRILNDSDYETLVYWWNNWSEWENAAPPKEMLPENGKGGIMIHKKSSEICAGFIYTTNSKIAWLEFVISNPNYREQDRKEAIALLINNLCAIAKNLGFKAVFTSVKNPFLINHFQKTGFSKDSKQSTEMVKRL